MIIRVRVNRGNKPVTETEDGLVVHTAEKRENNRANLDVMKQVARFYGIEASRVRLVSGRTSRNKTFLVDL